MPTRTPDAASLLMGAIQGSNTLPDHTIQGAARLAQEFFKEQEAKEWSGDPVETFAVPTWLRQGCFSCKPSVEHLGFAPTGAEGELVLTAGVDQHIDDAHGLTLMIVLHNDGLRFKQGKVSHAPVAGEWFIFDDRKKHGVSFGKAREVFVGWSIPLKLMQE